MIYASLMSTAVQVSEPTQQERQNKGEKSKNGNKRRRSQDASSPDVATSSSAARGATNNGRTSRATAKRKLHSTTQPFSKKVKSAQAPETPQQPEIEFRLASLFDPQQGSDTQMVQPWSAADKPSVIPPNSKNRTKTIRSWKRRVLDAREVIDYGGAVKKRFKLLHKRAKLMEANNNEEKEQDETIASKHEKQKGQEEKREQKRWPSDKEETSQPKLDKDSESVSTEIFFPNNEVSMIEAEDKDLLQQLVGSAEPTETISDDNPAPEQNFWATGLAMAKKKINLPSVQITARDIQSKAIENDNDDTLVVTLRRLSQRIMKGSIQGTGVLYPFRHDPRARMFDNFYRVVFHTSPQVFLRLLARRYLGNNASSSKEEQVGHITCLWKMPMFHGLIHGRNSMAAAPGLRTWQLHKWWQSINTRLARHLLWFIQNGYRLPGEGGQRKRLDFNERRIIKRKRKCKNIKTRREYPPHGAYLFIPLTSPPVPQFPLDRIEMTWGGVCRYSNSIQRFNEVPWFHYKLTTSIMLADRNQIKHEHNIGWCKEILEKEIKGVGYPKPYERPAYGVAQMVHHLLAIWNGSIDNERRSDWLAAILEDSSFAAMSDLHLTHALMAITANFEDKDAIVEILSRDPLEINPITMFQTIVNDHLPENVSLLEHTIHEHTSRRSVERNATDPIYYSWYIAFLATSLKLCQGTSSFPTIRSQLAQAVKLLYDLHSLAPSEQTVAALKALEQWRDVWCLLLMGSLEAKSNLRPVLPKHTDKFDKVALMLETNPASIRSWREVVKALGPVTKAKIWNLHDREWWYDLFLKPFEPVPSDASWFSSQVLLVDADGGKQQVTEKVFHRDASLQAVTIDTEWLSVLIADLQDSGTAADRFEPEDAETPELEINQRALPVVANDQLECLAYKVLLVAHFRTMDHPDVGWSLLALVDRLWEKTSGGLSSNGLLCLRWLRKMGVDVNKVFTDAVAHHNEEPIKNCAFNEDDQNQMHSTSI